MGWYETVSDAVYKALCASFGIDPTSNDGLKRFIPAYIESATNTQAPRNVDLTYYAISLLQDSGFDYIQVGEVLVNDVSKGMILKTIPVDVLFTFYGPNADDDAEEFWSNIQWDYGVNSPRAVLRNSNIVLIGEPSRPLYVYEVEGTYQRRRCDVRVNFAYMEAKEKSVGTVEVVPDIGLVPQANN